VRALAFSDLAMGLLAGRANHAAVALPMHAGALEAIGEDGSQDTSTMADEPHTELHRPGQRPSTKCRSSGLVVSTK